MMEKRWPSALELLKERALTLHHRKITDLLAGQGKNESQTVQITISTEVLVSVDMAWEAWTNPAHIVAWNHASDDWYCPKASNDLRVAGTFSATMAKDGSFSFDFEVVYNRVEPRKCLSYSLADDRKVLIQFDQIPAGTLVTEVFDAEHLHPVEMQRAGWQAILDNFKKHAESI